MDSLIITCVCVCVFFYYINNYKLLIFITFIFVSTHRFFSLKILTVIDINILLTNFHDVKKYCIKLYFIRLMYY